MILHRYAIVTQDINLLGNLLSSQKACLEFVHFRCPFAINALRYIFFKLGIFDILGIRIYRVHGRITFLVRTVLLQRIEATRHLLCIFRHRFLQVTAGRRHRTDERNGTHFAVVQVHIACTTVEVGNDSGQIHREGIRSRQFLHTVGHLAQSLCPT